MSHDQIDALQTTDNSSAAGSSVASKLSLESQNALLLQATLGKQMHAAERANPTVVDLGLEGAYSAVYSGAQYPALGLAQLLDRNDYNTKFEKSIDWMPAPEPAEFGSARWHFQQVGGAFGMMVPFLATRGAMKATGLSLAARTESTFLASSRLASGTNAAIVADGALTGFAYDFLWHPVKPEQGDFWEARRKNGYTGALTFAGLTAGSVGLRHATRPLAEGLKNPVSKGVYDFAMGAGSGAPAGVLNADASAYIHERRFATSTERIQGAYSFAMVGGVLSLAHKLPGQDKSVADRALETSTNKTAVRNVSEMLVERARLARFEASGKSGDGILSESMVGGRRQRGSAADLVANEGLGRGRALASNDVETRQMKTNVTPEQQASLQKGMNLAFEASEGAATTLKTVEFFEFARGEGAGLKKAMIDIAEQYGEPRLLTIVQEAYLAENPVHHRLILGKMDIQPDPGVKVTESQLQRWESFLQMMEKPPTDAAGYGQFRMNLFDWLNKNPDLHNWARQFGEQTDTSSKSGPIDFYFESSNLGRFVKASEGQSAIEKPMTVAEIATARRVSAEFADKVGVEPYDARMIENFVASVTEGKGSNLHMLAKHMNEALVKEKANTTASVGTEMNAQTTQITLYRPTTIKTSDPVGRVEYNAEGAIPEGAKFDAAQSNRVANEFAQGLAGARTIDRGQFLLAEAATNFRELGVPAGQIPVEMNWVFKNNRMPYEITVNEHGVLDLVYVQSKPGHVPLVSVRVTPEGEVVSKVHQK